MGRVMTKIFKAIVFICILSIVLYTINEAMIPKTNHNTATWGATDRYNQFYEMEENSIDVLFLGSSVVANAISPQEIYDDYGIRSYNLASSGQSIFFNYFWLKEALKTQSPKVVVLDTKFMFPVYPDSALNAPEGTYRECSNCMHWSSDKVEMINEICKYDKEQDKLSYFLTNLMYHDRWTELAEIDINGDLTEGDKLKGQSIITAYSDAVYDAFVPDGSTAKAETVPVMDEYLEKIVNLCKDNGIQLVLVTYPDTMTDATNNRMNEIAQKYELPYYNFCLAEHYYAIGAELPRENVIEHENVWGAVKMSKYMGGILQKEYGVPAVADEQWASTSYYYHHVLSTADLPHIEQFDQYLATLAGDDQYVTFVSVKDDSVRFITDKQIALLNQLGLKAPFKDMFRYSYSALIDPIEGNIEEVSGDEQMTISGSLDDGQLIYEVLSGGTDAGVACSIMVNGQEYAVNGVGFNFVVYDRVTQKVVDSVCFYTNEYGEYCKRQI